MKYTSIFHNETGENTWLVYDELTRNGVVIDPGCKIDDIMDMINENDVKVRYILLTHCHYDHIMSLIPLKNKTNAEIVTGARGSINLGDPNVNITLHGLGYEISGIHADKILKDNEILSLDGLNFKCIYTPGHTSCGVCYLIENDLFCGDTLFLRSCGRWDLPTGDMDILFDSIRNRLYTLPDNTIVHSGHGSDTSIGYEKNFNFCVRP